MITDEERRNIAARLRDMDESASVMDMILIIEPCMKMPYTWRDLAERIADLIEPPLQCPHYHSDIHYCSIHEDIQPIDRGAMLELADEMESFSAPLCMDCTISNYCERNDGAFSCADSWVREYADRMRKILGVGR